MTTRGHGTQGWYTARAVAKAQPAARATNTARTIGCAQPIRCGRGTGGEAGSEGGRSARSGVRSPRVLAAAALAARSLNSVDDHHLFRSGVRRELGDRVDIVGEADDVAPAIELIVERRPGVSSSTFTFPPAAVRSWWRR